MAVPKKKTSASKRGMRRAHASLRTPALVACPQCHKMKRPHHVCPFCGYYDGREVIAVEE